MTAIKVNCGCGFTAATIEAGEKHAVETGHVLHVQGEIKQGGK